MSDLPSDFVPPQLERIEAETRALGFSMASEELTGSLLRTLAASKPGGNLLELGTGTGLGTAWILSGMDRHAHLTTVDSDPAAAAVAKRHLGHDSRLSVVVGDASLFLAGAARGEHDFVFADAWPGKYERLEQALDLLKPGGIYVVDDLLPQPNWPAGHERHVERLLQELGGRLDLSLTWLPWSTGLVVATKLGPRAAMS